MPVIILIPFVIGVICLFRMSAAQIFLNVYLPVLMLFPIYFFFKMPFMPQLDFSQAALMALMIAIVVRELPGWRFTLSDIAIVVFVFSAGAADLLKNRDVATARQEILGSLLWTAIPYMAGKLLIENKGMRGAVVKRFVFLLFCAAIISMWEYRMGDNPFLSFWQQFFPLESFAWKTQFRWGFGRVAGPYAQSELAGIVFFIGLIFTLWLSRSRLWEPHFRNISWPRHRKGAVIGGMIAFTLLATQARGPWIGCVFALPVAMLGWARNIKRATTITLLVLVVGGGTVYTGLMAYSSGSVAASNEQQNAQYRQQLLTNYIPIAKAGGPWGYGIKFPQVDGQGSIDNEYLFLALTQGLAGLAAFVFLAVEAVVTLLRVGYTAPPGPDRSFAFCMLGIYAGLLFTICTVYLGNQPFELFFLFAGWSQALLPRREEKALGFSYVLT